MCRSVVADAVPETTRTEARIEAARHTAEQGGEERRRHRVMVTGNSEYHIRDRLCVGVRRADHNWELRHTAVGGELIATMQPNGSIRLLDDAPPKDGARLYFSGDLLTSPVRDMLRPTKSAVQHYGASPRPWCSASCVV